MNVGNYARTEGRTIQTGGGSRKAGVENEWLAEIEEHKREVKAGKIVAGSKEDREAWARLNRLRPQNWGTRTVYLDEDIVWYCMGKYQIREMQSFKPKVIGLAEKIRETKDRIRGWFGIEKESD